MPRVVALYRYPVKGFTPESCDALTALPDGRAAGDRVLGFRFADSPARDEDWSRKYEFLVLVNTPGLARLKVRYDHDARRLRIDHDGRLLVAAGLDGAGRKRLCDVLTDFVLGLDENPLAGHATRLPLRLVGDGVTPRYQDNDAGQITLHGRASLAAVAAACGEPGLHEARFRTNIVVDGIPAWEEHRWLGRRVRIGTVEFDVARDKTRCLATHANPDTGARDVPVMTVLVSRFGQRQPTFAVGMISRGPGGVIRVGDEVGPV
ncbi:MAG: MOSC domain-containing protein [Burkholderiales bacterium]|nr:MOSC domain-containing protein [Burkholderiales bacterium]